MERIAQHNLKEWLYQDSRKPLVLRGARQVGKTWLVRDLAERCNLKLIEINFEKNPGLKAFFESNDPHIVLSQLELHQGCEIDRKTALLFLDEVQVFPEILAKLRWFYEDLPELPVIAAGSLLDFVLADHTFSMPVGRISYYHLEPFSFDEFLCITGNNMAFELLTGLSIDDIKKKNSISPPIHNKLLELFRIYTLVGGMPEALAAWLSSGSYHAVARVHQELLTTYRDDFSKYSGKINKDRLHEVMLSVPGMLGNKFKYSNVNKDVRSETVKTALNLLCTARLIHKVYSSSAEGIPLASTVNYKMFKTIFIDCGLASASLGLILDSNFSVRDLNLANKGAIAEQVVGQILRTLEPAFIEPALYYWTREKQGAEAEVDYILQDGTDLIPIEVKSGSTGSLKSLHSLMYYKHLKYAVRINSDLPSLIEIKNKIIQNSEIKYTLLSLPFYMTSQIKRIQLPII